MKTHAPCLPGTGQDHKPLQHDDCVRAWYHSMGWGVNTHTCLTDPSRLTGGPTQGTHDARCGPLCPGPVSQAVETAKRAQRAVQRKRGGRQ